MHFCGGRGDKDAHPCIKRALIFLILSYHRGQYGIFCYNYISLSNTSHSLNLPIQNQLWHLSLISGEPDNGPVSYEGQLVTPLAMIVKLKTMKMGEGRTTKIQMRKTSNIKKAKAPISNQRY